MILIEPFSFSNGNIFAHPMLICFQPFCDGQHRKYQTGLSPLRFKAEETGTAFLCGCKQTYNPPYCDGTHTCDAVQNS